MPFRRRSGDVELEFFELTGGLESLFLELGRLGGALGLELFEFALGRLGGERGESLREEIVAGVSGGDLDDLAGLAELIHVVHEHYFDSHLLNSFLPDQAMSPMLRARFTPWRI